MAEGQVWIAGPFEDGMVTGFISVAAIDAIFPDHCHTCGDPTSIVLYAIVRGKVQPLTDHLTTEETTKALQDLKEVLGRVGAVETVKARAFAVGAGTLDDEVRCPGPRPLGARRRG